MTMTRDIHKIIEENKDRWKRLNVFYNPLVGAGSPVKRVQLLLSEREEIFVPESMMETDLGEAIQKAGTFDRAIAILQKHEEVDRTSIQKKFVSLRCKHDFEFWTATCVKVPNRKGELVFFVLNHEQRIILVELEAMRLSGVPIRAVILKSRQIGISTLTQLYIAWLQLFHVPGKNAFIIADEQGKAKNILEMYIRMGRYHPPGIVPDLPEIAFKPYAQSHNQRQVIGREQFVGVSAANDPSGTRNFTVQLFQCSEVAYWIDTEANNPRTLIQAVMGTFPKNQAYTLYVEESTANGPNDYFHKSCRASWEGRSNDKFIFVPFFENSNEYFKKVDDPVSFWASLNEYETFQWDRGATLEHILWWRDASVDVTSKGGEIWRVKWEYPSTKDEPFEGSETRVYKFEYVEKVRVQCRPPIARGHLIGDTQKGKDSLKGIKFQPNDKGDLVIWKYPGSLVMGRAGKKYSNRYAFFGDVGGTKSGADWSGGKIFDRSMLAFGGGPEVVAELHTHMEPDLLAWYAARLCIWYDTAHLCFEMNRRIADPEIIEPDSSYTILNEIGKIYPNLYYRVKPETVKEHWDGVIGFWTSAGDGGSKKMIIDNHIAACRDGEYEERSVETCDEMDVYEYKDTGRKKMGAKPEYHDDRVIYTAGGVWLCSQMDPVIEIDITTHKPYKSPEGHPAVFG